MRYLVCSLFVVSLACLPDDTRDPPARAELTIAPSEARFTTADGWALELSRFIVSIGHAEPISNDCARYSENDYARIIDVLRPETQRIATIYALGSCRLGLGVVPVQFGHTARGAGIDDETEARMMILGPDLMGHDSGTSMEMHGRARSGDRTISFRWTFRRPAAFDLCEPLELTAEASFPISLRAVGSALFRAGVDDEELRFDAIAAADADGDGEVTLTELDQAPAEGEPFRSVARRIYEGLFHAIIEGIDFEICRPMPRQG